MLETFFITYGEELQYFAFFGGMAVFALWEVVRPAIGRAPDRLRRWRTNFAMTALGILTLGVLPITTFAAALWAQSQQIGLLNMVELSGWSVVVITLLARSLISWLVHFASHKVPLLWRIHRVHHLDTHLDVSTTFRLHPLESVIGFFIVIPVVIGFGLSPWVLIVYEVLDAGINVFTHANIRLPKPLDRVLRLAIVTPDMHRIHHSSFQPETDSNYGAVFSFWDRLFGTYVRDTARGPDTLELGLESVRDKRSCGLFWLLLSPFRPLAV